jgi:hypothetical protein
VEAHIIANKEKIQTDHFNSQDHGTENVLLMEFLPQSSTVNAGVFCDIASCDPEQATWHG